MNQQTLVSVILSTFNREKYVKKAINSVLNQTYKNIEIIIVDDCSSDGTLKIVSEYCNKDSRIIILKNEINFGIPKSWNKGITAAKGKYIARLDDDDFWTDPKKLEKQVEFLNNNRDYILTGGGAIWIDKNGKEIFRYLLPENDKDIKKYILSDNCFVHSTVVFRKRDWEKIGGYNEKFGQDCDWALWLELGKSGKFYNFPEYFTYYLKWEENISNFNTRDARDNMKNQIKLRYNYRNDYTGYLKSFFLGLTYYFFSFLPFRNTLKPILIKFKKIIFGKFPYNSKNR